MDIVPIVPFVNRLVIHDIQAVLDELGACNTLRLATTLHGVKAFRTFFLHNFLSDACTDLAASSFSPAKTSVSYHPAHFQMNL